MRPISRALPVALCSLLLAACAAAAVERDHDIVPADYFDLASVTALAVSPDGRFAAYVESRWGEAKEGRRNDLWVVDLASREPLRLTFDGFGAADLHWDHAARWIYFTGRQERAGEESPPYDGQRQVWRVPPTGGEPFPVTRAAKGVGRCDLAGDGRTLYYTTGEKIYAEAWKDLHEEYKDLEYGHGVSELDALHRLDLVSWRDEEVLPAERVIHAMALAPDGRRLALICTDDRELIFKEGWSRLEVVELSSREVTPVTSQAWRQDQPSPFGWLAELAWSHDGNALAFAIDFDGYPSQVHVAEWGGGRPQLRRLDLPGLVSFDGGLQWRGKEHTLCFRGERFACVRIYATEDVRGGRQGSTHVLTPGDPVVEDFDFAADGDRLVALLGTTTDMADLYLVDGKGRRTRVTDLNPQVASWRLPQIQQVGWVGAEGDSVHGILELPPAYRPGDGPLPAVLELHGGPTSSTKYRLRLWIYGRALLPARGYAVLSPNYRGSTGYGDAFLSELIGRENDIEVRDILAGLDWLEGQGIADPARVGVMGWSNGGYLTNCLITAAPERFKAASSGAGVLDMALQWATEDTPGHVINYMQGLPWENLEAYVKASPLYSLDRMRTPTLIHVGGADPRVPPAHSRALFRALYHYLGIPVELVVYPGEPHSLSTHEHRLAKMKWDLAWFDKYLLDNDGQNTD